MCEAGWYKTFVRIKIYSAMWYYLEGVHFVKLYTNDYMMRPLPVSCFVVSFSYWTCQLSAVWCHVFRFDFEVNKLSLNVNKTNFIMFTNKTQLRPTVNIVLNGKNIEQVWHTKFLGVIIDENFTWREHIKTVETKVSKGIGVLNKTKDVLNIQALRTLYQSLVEPFTIYNFQPQSHFCYSKHYFEWYKQWAGVTYKIPWCNHWWKLNVERADKNGWNEGIKRYRCFE